MPLCRNTQSSQTNDRLRSLRRANEETLLNWLQIHLEIDGKKKLQGRADYLAAEENSASRRIQHWAVIPVKNCHIAGIFPPGVFLALNCVSVTQVEFFYPCICINVRHFLMAQKKNQFKFTSCWQFASINTFSWCVCVCVCVGRTQTAAAQLAASMRPHAGAG